MSIKFIYGDFSNSFFIEFAAGCFYVEYCVNGEVFLMLNILIKDVLEKTNRVIHFSDLAIITFTKNATADAYHGASTCNGNGIVAAHAHTYCR